MTKELSLTQRDNDYTFNATISFVETSQCYDLTIRTKGVDAGWKSVFYVRYTGIGSLYFADSIKLDKSIVHVNFILKNVIIPYKTESLTPEHAQLLVNFLSKDTWIGKKQLC
jgi:hypothetical protein